MKLYCHQNRSSWLLVNTADDNHLASIPWPVDSAPNPSAASRAKYSVGKCCVMQEIRRRRYDQWNFIWKRTWWNGIRKWWWNVGFQQTNKLNTCDLVFYSVLRQSIHSHSNNNVRKSIYTSFVLYTNIVIIGMYCSSTSNNGRK